MLGNFVNRVTKFCVARFDGKVPGEGDYGAEEQALIAELDQRVAQYTSFMEEGGIPQGDGRTARHLGWVGNEYPHPRRALDP